MYIFLVKYGAVQTESQFSWIENYNYLGWNITVMIPYNYNIEIKLLEACVLFLILLLLTERGILPLVSVTIQVMLLYPEIQQKKK